LEDVRVRAGAGTLLFLCACSLLSAAETAGGGSLGASSAASAMAGAEDVAKEMAEEMAEDLAEDLARNKAEDTVNLPVVNITGRNPKTAPGAPLPTTLVSGRYIRAGGATRLDQLLEEETGLAIVQDHGSGIQMQGLDPDYTLILLDGEPAVGRIAGTLDLGRFAVGNLKQVEIVKGPASSRYGSEALGGVVNLVTRQPSDSFALSLRSRYGTFNTLNTDGELELKRGDLGLMLYAERGSTDGFDAEPSSIARTAPGSTEYTLQPKVVWDPGAGTRLTLSSRMGWQDQKNRAMVAGADSAIPSRERSTLLDWSASSALERDVSRSLQLTAKAHFMRYRTLETLRSETEDASLSRSAFDQRLFKTETFLNFKPGKAHEATIGGGVGFESVAADRIAQGKHGASSGFAFVQEDWTPGPRFSLQISGRFDAHQDYPAHFSPRAAALAKPFPWLSLRASVGNGFKAPAFQELYLDFTNPQVGYSVFGSAGARDGLERLRAQGQIQNDLQNPGSGGDLRPENSWSFNAGWEIEAGKRLSFRTNFFRNDVDDLIESAPIAAKFNGQSVYTYFNLARIHTRGIEAETAWQPSPRFSLSTGYQYLEAEDDKVLEEIKAGSIFKIGSTGRVRPVRQAEYGGLFNRSRHSATLRLSFAGGKTGFSGNLRGAYHGRYGYADRNQNGILDADDEYQPGYTVWNATCNQKLGRFFALQAGMNDILDETSPDLVPARSGRTLFAGFSLRYL
jgi:outer membrane receptor for ferrienterochelin and colicins